MAAFVAGLLGMSQQELRFRVQRANHMTVAPLLSLFHSVSPLLGLTQSSSDLPASEESLSPSPSSESAQGFKGLDGEQTHADSDAPALASPRADTISVLELTKGEPQIGLCEQGLCGRGQALPQGEEEEGKLQRFCSGEGLGEVPSHEGGDEDETLGAGLAAAATVRAGMETSIVQLDQGCLAQIISQMDLSSLRACSLVCRDWLEVSSSARTSVTLRNGPQIAAFPKLVARFSRIHTLHVEGRAPADAPSVLSLDDAVMEVLAQSCGCLRELRLKYCSLSDAGLAAVLRGCPELLVLGLAHSEGFSGEAFSGLCCKLEKLELNVCEGLTNEGLVVAAAACSGLKDFGIYTAQPNRSLEQGVEAFSKACPGLKVFAVHACRLTDEALQRIAARCPLIQQISVTCEYYITDRGLDAFLALLPRVHTVTLQKNRAVSGIPQFGSNRCLRRLRLGWLCTTPDEVLKGLANQAGLEELVLICCPFLTDATVEKILTCCKKLTWLMLHSSKLVTAETVSAYIRCGSKARLEIKRCSGMKKGALGQDVLKLKKLQVQCF
ncbi:F-box/RNI-like superfamily protein [Klebsormidium nitens]|uniref:F-box/RNI-like superfamily protein n=1 Tax=Klebsormidium nitens TaxID=105231 RepID=A0A1Y1IMK6_KLENI|nr:F-box/RNI-like superfamily protein [Klebsormidium nitens]|eukprot:GAQ89348.1 F-box/RNI-like superfamily protein [Klebsormidium nitens]